jgi:dienelactone hydrolase
MVIHWQELDFGDSQMRGLQVAVFLGFLFAASGGSAGARSEQIVLDNDGWEIHGVWQPIGRVAPAVLLLHGPAGDRNDFATLADAVITAGMHALQLELRGHGQSTNLGRFEPPYQENRHINQAAWRDIVAGIDWLRERPSVEKVVVVGASYSGEQAALALLEGETPADAYVMFSPGNFQDKSIDAIEPSGVPWLFVRTVSESPASLRWIDEIYALLPNRAPTAEVIIYPGAGHAAKMFEGRPELPVEIARWIANAFADD